VKRNALLLRGLDSHLAQAGAIWFGTPDVMRFRPAEEGVLASACPVDKLIDDHEVAPVHGLAETSAGERRDDLPDAE